MYGYHYVSQNEYLKKLRSTISKTYMKENSITVIVPFTVCVCVCIYIYYIYIYKKKIPEFYFFKPSNITKRIFLAIIYGQYCCFGIVISSNLK